MSGDESLPVPCPLFPVPCPLFPVPLILASGSPRRRELLAALGVAFEVRPTDVPERLVEGLPAGAQARELALSKALAVARSLPLTPSPNAEGGGVIVLGADTIVVLDGAPLGKPDGADDARRMLGALRGRGHEVVTGVAVAWGGARRACHAVTAVHMRDYTNAEIEAYIAGGDPFDKAGAYAIQHGTFRPVGRIDGCYCNVMGLPLWTVRRLLTEAAPDLVTNPPSQMFERCATCPLR